MFCPLPRPDGDAVVIEHVTVIGVGNSFRRDDGVGPAVAAAVDARAIPGVRVVTDVVEPTGLLDAWADVDLAIVVDAATSAPSAPGRIHRCTKDQFVAAPTVSSHGVDLATVIALGEALDRMPGRLVLFAVEVADTGYGAGLTPKVEAAVGRAAAAVMGEIGRGSFGCREEAEMPWSGFAR
jgi:hydrogenase maturation protease